MNYRHIYHAGNFADVFKHLAICMIIDYLQKKDAPFCVIDAHGGCGFYDLQSEEAQKTVEWMDGIGRFEDGADTLPDDFKLYYERVKTDLAKGFYPGSPLLVASMLRGVDRLIANELHPVDVETLKDKLYGRSNVRVTALDAYECIRANIPPQERRGLILIDPPFEQKDEFRILARQIGEWKKRFANGQYLIWYPVKPHLEIDRMKQAAVEAGLPRTWFGEILLHPREQEGVLNGCGLILFNAPYQIPERLEALLPLLTEKLGLTESESGWLTSI